MKHNILPKIILVASLLLIEQAFANTASNTFQSSATLSSSCTVSATNIDFGFGDNTLANINSSGALSINCSKSVVFSLGMNGGLNGSSGRSPSRRLNATTSGNTDTLAYSLFQDSAFTKSIGSVSPSLISGVGTGFIQTIPFYAQLSTYYATPDIYTDTITISLNY